MFRRKNARLVAMALALVVVAACLFYLFTRFDWREPLRVLRDANLAALVGALVCVQFAYICVRTLRWQLVVRDRNPEATFGALYWITAIVVSLSILTPGQIGETVKVELLKRRGFGNRLPGLGSFAIERLDPEGISHVAVIKLRLENIDRAVAPTSSNLSGPFIPFAGLSKTDRYTEVFAHEMGHAVDILFNQPRAVALDEILRNTNVIVQDQLQRAKGLIDPELMVEILRRDAFLNELEKPAESAEAAVWRELVSSSQERS